MDSLAGKELVTIDLRTRLELKNCGTIPGAINIPIDDLRSKLEMLDKSKTYVLYCAIGLRGYIGYRILSQHGFDAVSFCGGYEIFRNAKELAAGE